MKIAWHYNPGGPLFQWMNWNGRGVIVRVGPIQLDIFWRPQWSPGRED